MLYIYGIYVAYIYMAIWQILCAISLGHSLEPKLLPYLVSVERWSMGEGPVCPQADFSLQ